MNLKYDILLAITDRISFELEFIIKFKRVYVIYKKEQMQRSTKVHTEM